MFITADRLLAMSSGRRSHAISFYWDGFEPHFEIYSGESGTVGELQMDRFSFTVSEEQKCVGSFRNGAYRPCPLNRHVENMDQCDFCSRTLIPIQKCLFDPICDGEICDWDLCRREHSVYLAFYGGRMKVGMTSTTRIRERLIEQGADAYMVAGRFRSRKAAREMEKKVSQELGISQTHRYSDILSELRTGTDYDVIQSNYSSICSELDKKFDLKCSGLEVLDGYPITQPLESTPLYTDITGFHEGDVIGVKGKIAVYRSSGLRALNLSAIPSRFIISV
jgi:hypothetical protein